MKKCPNCGSTNFTSGGPSKTSTGIMPSPKCIECNFELPLSSPAEKVLDDLSTPPVRRFTKMRPFLKKIDNLPWNKKMVVLQSLFEFNCGHKEVYRFQVDRLSNVYISYVEKFSNIRTRFCTVCNADREIIYKSLPQ